MTQNIFSLKSGPKGCKGLWNNNDLQKYLGKMKILNFEDICWPLKLCLRDFAEQSLHCSIILRGKERSLRNFAGQRMKALWFRGAKSALLHNFAGQSLHCSIILGGKNMYFRAKIQQKMRFYNFFKKYFNMWQLFQRSIAPWWPLFRKKINCRTVPLMTNWQIFRPSNRIESWIRPSREEELH